MQDHLAGGLLKNHGEAHLKDMAVSTASDGAGLSLNPDEEYGTAATAARGVVLNPFHGISLDIPI